MPRSPSSRSPSRPDRGKPARIEPPQTADRLAAALLAQGYVADNRTALALWLAASLERPLLVEGPAGVGKTELARAAASALGRNLLRLSCYEGLDEGKALYEWDYAKQMLVATLVRDAVASSLPAGRSGAKPTVADAVRAVASSEASFFDRRFLIPRPLLAALESDVPTVLLLDEVDRADPEFEAFLLELLADMQVTIPEIGTIKAKHTPLVVLTTNGTREMTDALRRRCLHAFVDYPSPARELTILEARVPEISGSLASSVVQVVAKLRAMDLRKAPSIGETIDWARALLLLGKSALDEKTVEDTLGVLLKHEEDRARAEERLAELAG